MRWLCAFFASASLTACGSTTRVSGDDERAPLECHPGYHFVDGVCRVIEIFVPGGTFVLGAGYCFPEAAHQQEFEAGDCALSDEPHEVTVGDLWVDAVEVPEIEAPHPEYIAKLAETCPQRTADCGHWSALRTYAMSDLTGSIDPCAPLGKRLPTEAEWEYFATAGGTRPYPWGSQAPNCELASFGECKSKDETVATTVGMKPPSPEGFYDLAGNAAELVGPVAYTSGYPAPPIIDYPNDFDPHSDQTRPFRGGSVQSPAHLLRSAHRSSSGSPDQGPPGFRCVRDP